MISKMLYMHAVTYLRISTFVYTFLTFMCTVKYCALCITESDRFLVAKNRGFLKTELR